MSSIFSAITDLIGNAQFWAMDYLRLFFTWGESPGGGGSGQVITGLTFLGLFCIAIPLVGLGIGIIRRLVNIRA